MAKVKTVHRCTECGAGFPKWAGKCGSCGAWNTLIEEVDRPTPLAAVGSMLLGGGEPPRPISQVDSTLWIPRSTGIAEVDRVLGGGLVPGSVTLLGGEPGIGKSTLLLQLLGEVAKSGRRSLLVSGEESVQQVRLRAQRLESLSDELWIAGETDLGQVLAHLSSVKPEVCVIDSIQTIASAELESAPGTVSQVRDCATAITRAAKELGIAVLLVGHVTKEGGLAGPRVLEHLVDTVLSFDGDRNHQLRLLRAVKHRFGATGELGVFEMAGEGLVAVADPSAMLLGDRHDDVAGSVLVPVIEGNRPILVEVQGLVAETTLNFPRRIANGMDNNRLAVLLAVLEKRVGLPISFADVFVSVVGGIRLVEPAADLAVAMAVMSSACDLALPPKTVLIGEIGLAGELRQVGQPIARLQEAFRLGMTNAVIPANSPPITIAGMSILRADSILDAGTQLGVTRAPHRIRGRRPSASGSDESPIRRFPKRTDPEPPDDAW
jgi:DNA repair protein RadA/Sms